MSSCSKMSLAMAALIIAGCSGGQMPSETRIAKRLIPVGDYSPAAAARFFDEVEVARWDFSDPSEVDRWTSERIDAVFEKTDTGLRLRSSSADPSLYRTIDLQADDVKAFRIHEAGLTSDAYIQLYWAGPGEGFSENKTIGASACDPTGSLTPSYTFPVQNHKNWTGDIAMFRIDPTSVADRRLEIFSLTALDYVPNPDLIAATSQQPWRVDIRGDVRNAMLTPPGFDFETTVEIPDQAWLNFAIGLDPRMTEAVTFEIVARSEEGMDKQLFKHTLEPKGSQWYDNSIDLGSWARKNTTLTFKTSSAEALDLFRGFPAWANIQIVEPLHADEDKQKNVVLIVVDTLRADHVSAYGYERETTPNIDAWARDHGVLFENTVASAPWTIPSHVSMFTGLDSFSHGVNTGDPMPPSLTTMAEILAQQGYETHAITGGAYLTDAFGMLQGFDSAHYWRPPSGDPIDAGNDIVDGIRRSLDFLDQNRNKPFFLFFHTYEVHTPYRARESYFSDFSGSEEHRLVPPVDTLPLEPVRENGYVISAAFKARFGSKDAPYSRITEKDLPVVRSLYDSGVAFADSQIGTLLTRIEQLGLDKDTIVILTSDHGESLGEQGQFEHKTLHEWNLLVPLIVSSPDHANSAGNRVQTQVRLIDLLPTVVDLLDLPDAPEMTGASLSPLLADPSAEHPTDAWSYASSSNSGLSLRRNNSLKYVFNNTVWPQVYGKEGLFDLTTDPKTEVNLAPDDPRAGQLYSEAATMFEKRMASTRILFSNQMDVPMDAHIKGHIAQPVRIKGFDIETNFLEWRYQMLNMVVPPHRSLVFHLEGNPFGDLFVTARFDVPSPHRTGIKQVMSLHEYEQPWQASFDGKKWAVGAESNLEDVSGIRVWIEAPVDPGSAPTVIDEESRLFLKKLGYIQ